MKMSIQIAVFIFIISVISCEKNELKVTLNVNENLSFSGAFKTISSENISGTVNFNMSNMHYVCSTDLPYGYGAGKLETNETTINFIDTLFFAIPAIYGPSYVLSGEYYYIFDGENLKIWREKNVGSIEYDLKLIK